MENLPILCKDVDEQSDEQSDGGWGQKSLGKGNKPSVFVNRNYTNRISVY